jgi:glycosyltransferase involved in cell wall biosynthesis
MNLIEVFPLTDDEAHRPIWSVMIPTYNCARYMRETITSVLRQDRGSNNMEIWVVDDCSKDNPQLIVEELGKGRVNFFRQKQNVGQLNNFSTCLNLAKGKIIHLLHGDDFVHPSFYEQLETPLLSYKNIGAAFTGNNIVDGNGKLLFASDVLASNAGVIDNFLSIITRKQVIQTPSIVVKREVYEKIGAFNRDLNWVEDWEMWIRIACNYDFYYDPRPLASYRIHDNSNTEDSINTGRFIKDALNCINVYSGYLQMSLENKKQIVNAARQHFINFALQQANARLSAVILFRALPLVYNFSSFLCIINGTIIVMAKPLKGRLQLMVKMKKYKKKVRTL